MSKPSLLITRPYEDSVTLARNLRGRGVTLYVQPLLTVHSVPFEREALKKYDHIILTSQNAVRSASSAFSSHQTFWCVGDRTALACKNAGFQNVKSAQRNASSLYQLILEQGSKGIFLHVSGRDVTYDFSQSKELNCERVIVYETQSVTLLRPRIHVAITQGKISHVFLYSQKSARALASLVDLPKHITLLVLSDEISSIFPKNPKCIIRDDKEILPLLRGGEGG